MRPKRRDEKPRRARAGVAQARVRSNLEPLFSERGRLLLETTALSGGLPQVRYRSSPERVAWEARRFVRVLATALGDEARQPRALVEKEVRLGALAAATPTDVAAIFAVWRQALESAVAGLGLHDRAHAGVVALAKLERAMMKEAERWAAERIDIVAIGASAGGVPSLSALMAALPPELPATVLVVLHVSPRSPSLLASILARRSRIAIANAVDGSQLYLGNVYVAPPGRHLVVGERDTHLVDGPTVHFVKPSADVLFESAALAHGSRLASIVLTGTGADGATGTRAVHEHGGVTIAQDPETAEYRGMPDAAIATGMVDLTLPLGSLGGMIRRLTTEGRSASRTGSRVPRR